MVSELLVCWAFRGFVRSAPRSVALCALLRALWLCAPCYALCGFVSPAARLCTSAGWVVAEFVSEKKPEEDLRMGSERVRTQSKPTRVIYRELP